MVHNVSFLPWLLLHTVLIFLPSVDAFAGFNARLLYKFMCVCAVYVCVCVCVLPSSWSKRERDGGKGRERNRGGGRETLTHSQREVDTEKGTFTCSRTWWFGQSWL